MPPLEHEDDDVDETVTPDWSRALIVALGALFLALGSVLLSVW